MVATVLVPGSYSVHFKVYLTFLEKFTSNRYGSDQIIFRGLGRSFEILITWHRKMKWIITKLVTKYRQNLVWT